MSSIFTRPKKDGSLRMILNLKSFKKFIEYKHFKMESISSPLNLFTEGVYMGSAFQAVPFGKLFYRELESHKSLSLKLNKGNFDSKVRLNNESLNELAWWKLNIMESTNSIITPNICLLYTSPSPRDS